MKTDLKIKIRSLELEYRVITDPGEGELRVYGPDNPKFGQYKLWHQNHPMFARLLGHATGILDEMEACKYAQCFLRNKPFTAMRANAYYPISEHIWDRIEANVRHHAGYIKNDEDGNPVEVTAQEAALGFTDWITDARISDNPTICKQRRRYQNELGRKRRFNYHKKYLTHEPPETQAELKARLKAKWLHDNSEPMGPIGDSRSPKATAPD